MIYNILFSKIRKKKSDTMFGLPLTNLSFNVIEGDKRFLRR